MQAAHHTIWTIGHSTRTIAVFLEMLQAFGIARVVDVRRFPGSRSYPQFNKEDLCETLSNNHILYEHIEALGGRRKTSPASENTAWRHPAFRGYADYMQTPAFADGICRLEQLALTARTAYMCSEAVWWRCHRAMISDVLKANGWNVQHIMEVGKATEHPFTAPARIVNGQLSYKPGITGS